MEHEAQVLIGGVGVADVELDRLPDADVVGEGEGFVRLVDADQVADEKIPAPEALAIFADGPADEQTVLQ